jgi:hypothetical protein
MGGLCGKKREESTTAK